MQIDNKNFIAFMQSLYFMGYYIKYIDKAHEQSICKNSATLIDDDGNIKRLRYPLQKDLLKAINNILAEQDYCQLINPIITTLFIRLGNAIICIKHKNF